MPKANLSHPTKEQLAEFESGRMAEPEAVGIEAHVAECPACVTTLDALPRDTLVSLLKKQPATGTWSTKGPATPDGFPEQFGRYRILKELGKGGMGSVYLAHDTKLDRQVALKVPQIPDDNPAILERFRREAQAMGEFRHPNLCPIYDVDEINGIHFYTMPYIAGISLHAWIEKKGLPGQRQVAVLIRKLALALLEAHKRGVIHRDLKPGNIMIEKNARGTHEPIIVDFGLAKREKADDLRLTHTGAAMGTPAYMPPEQLRGQLDKIGPNCDIYSLGATMYELLTGRRPFENSNWAELTDEILHKHPSPPTSIRPEVDPRLAAICLKCLEKDIKDRYLSMQELADELSKYLNAVAPPANRQPQNTIEGMFAEIGGDGPRPEPRIAATAWKGRLPKWGWLVAAGAGAALVLVVGIVIIIETKDGKVRIELEDTNAKVTIQQGTGPGKSAPAKADGAPPVARKNDYDAIATGKWIAVLRTEEEFKDAESMKLENGVLRALGLQERSRAYLRDHVGLDMIIRAKVKMVNSQGVNLNLRGETADGRNENKYQLNYDGRRFDLWKNIGSRGDLLNRGQATENYDDFFELALAVVGDTLTGYANGKEVVRARDGELKQGYPWLAARYGSPLKNRA